MERCGDTAAFSAATVSREHEKKNLPKPRKKTTAYQTAKARRYGGLFCLYGKRAAEKICLLPIYAEPAETGRQALLHSPLRAPSQANAQATRRELQDSRSYACGCVPNVQLLRKRKRQHLTKAEQPNVLKRENAFRARVADTGRRAP